MKCPICNADELIYDAKKDIIRCYNNHDCNYEFDLDITEPIDYIGISVKNTIIELLEESEKLSKLEETVLAEDNGGKSYYVGAKEGDNPYIGTYNRPESIIKGVNDGDMTKEDYHKFNLERSWYNGWIKEDTDVKQKMEIINLKQENIKLYNKFLDIISKMNTKLTFFCRSIPFFRKNIKKKIIKIRNEITDEVIKIGVENLPEK